MIETGDGRIPSERTVRIALWTPLAAVAFALTWSWLARLALGRGDIDRLTFWAGDLPLLPFGVPAAAAVWLWTSLCSAWQRLGWQVLILVVYYGAAAFVALLGMIVVAGLPVGDL